MQITRKQYRLRLAMTIAWLALLLGTILYIGFRKQEWKLTHEINQGTMDVSQIQILFHTLKVSYQELKTESQMAGETIRNVTRSAYHLQSALFNSVLCDREMIHKNGYFFEQWIQTANSLEIRSDGEALSAAMVEEALQQDLHLGVEELRIFTAAVYEKTVEFFNWQSETYGLHGPDRRTMQEKRSDLRRMKALYQDIMGLVPSCERREEIP